MDTLSQFKGTGFIKGTNIDNRFTVKSVRGIGIRIDLTETEGLTIYNLSCVLRTTRNIQKLTDFNNVSEIKRKFNFIQFYRKDWPLPER